jgi:MFS family permease
VQCSKAKPVTLNIMPRAKTKITFSSVSSANFFFSLALFTILYINSSFFSLFLGEKGIGVLYIVSALLAMGTLIMAPAILERFGNYMSILVASLLATMILIGLAAFTRAEFILPLGAILGSLFLFITFSIDIFVKGLSKSVKRTGHLRGTTLTITNTALILGPLFVGFFLTNGDYWKVYLLSSIFLTIGLLIAFFRFDSFRNPSYDVLNFGEILKKIQGNKDLLDILGAHFLLRMFFAWMVIYMPIYLHQYIGFSWSEIGIIFTIMLLPFVLFELPIGKIADDFLGEKELLLTGFVILIFSTASITVMSSTSVISWALLLFLTRVGASFIEITTESYFFKKVDKEDASIISAFRMLRPLSYIAAATLGTIALFIFPFHATFFILALYTALALPLCLSLHDTK